MYRSLIACLRCWFKVISHIPQSILIILVTINLINISNMACEIGELRDLKLNVPFHKGLQLTDSLTDPNNNSHNSQKIIISPLSSDCLLVTCPLNYSLSTNHLTGMRWISPSVWGVNIRDAPFFHYSFYFYAGTSAKLGRFSHLHLTRLSDGWIPTPAFARIVLALSTLPSTLPSPTARLAAAMRNWRT